MISVITGVLMFKMKLDKLLCKDCVKTEYKSEIEKESESLLKAVEDERHKLSIYYCELASTDDIDKYSDEVEGKIISFRKTNANLLKACKHIVAASDELSARYTDISKGQKKHRIPTAPANSVIDIEERSRKSFAAGLNYYKLLLICFIGSFAGVVIEMIWCLLKNGYLESRAGLIIGPFNLLYGIGAVTLSLALYRFRNNRKWLSFLGGMIVGTVVEYLCSFFQEAAFGSRSWDYSAMPFNINGRVCLLYSVFWGLLGVLWVKTIYPWMAKLLLKIPDRTGKILTWLIFAFLILNSVLTVVSVWRWSQRMDMIPATNAFFEMIDRMLPNEKMERIFANMVFN